MGFLSLSTKENGVDDSRWATTTTPLALMRSSTGPALAEGGTIAETAERLGIMGRAEMEALLVPERLTQPVRLVA